MNEKENLTVHQVSEMTGISVRTLHYYDEIGLLPPSTWSDSGYRLYDDKALEVLHQILFFRELDVPLKDIKRILANPNLNRTKILQNQRKMLALKKKHFDALLQNIDAILNGSVTMSFEVFSKKEIEDFYSSVKESLKDEDIEMIGKQFGSIDSYHESFVEKASTEKEQKSFAKMMEWYKSDKIQPAYQKRFAEICEKLRTKMKSHVAPDTFEAKAVIGELDFVLKQYLQLDDVAFVVKSSVEDDGKSFIAANDGINNESEENHNFIAKYGKDFFDYYKSVIAEFYK